MPHVSSEKSPDVPAHCLFTSRHLSTSDAWSAASTLSPDATSALAVHGSSLMPHASASKHSSRCATTSLRNPVAKSPSLLVQPETQPAPASRGVDDVLQRAERAHEALHMSR